MGMAETPAAPMIGFIFCLKNKLTNFTPKIPPTVEKIKATTAKPMITKVRGLKKIRAGMSPPTHIAKRNIRMSFSALPAVASRSVTPLTFNKLPNIIMPTRGAHFGTSSVAIMKTMIGKRTSSNRDTFLI